MEKGNTVTISSVLLPCQQRGEGFIRRKIGNTIYRVSVKFSDTSKERLEDKILRLARNDALNFAENYPQSGLSYAAKCGKIDSPQTGRLLDGGSLL